MSLELPIDDLIKQLENYKTKGIQTVNFQIYYAQKFDDICFVENDKLIIGNMDKKEEHTLKEENNIIKFLYLNLESYKIMSKSDYMKLKFIFEGLSDWDDIKNNEVQLNKINIELVHHLPTNKINLYDILIKTICLNLYNGTLWDCSQHIFNKFMDKFHNDNGKIIDTNCLNELYELSKYIAG